MHYLIDTDTGHLVAHDDTLEQLLPHTDLLPSDVVPAAADWQAVVQAAEGYDGGISDLLECFRVLDDDGIEDYMRSARFGELPMKEQLRIERAVEMVSMNRASEMEDWQMMTDEAYG